MTYNEEDLHVIVTYGYWSSDINMGDTLYDDPDEAKKLARERQDRFPNLTFKVMTLGDYMSELRDVCRCR